MVPLGGPLGRYMNAHCLDEWARRIEDLDAQAEDLLDIASTLAHEVAGSRRSEVLSWATSVRTCSGSA